MIIKKKTLIVTLLLITTFSVFLFWNLGNKSSDSSVAGVSNTTSNVKYENGVQIVEVTATSGGYSPQKSIVKADIPTILRINSKNAYGCERSFVIASKQISKILPTNGVTEIEIGENKKDKRITGACSMGMYSFNISFI